ncbi:spore cortex biosynthesis protein YabQ [Clostridium senegalense]|uniref:Spore cortex biosynthesis protein YabQ n=1 Tax=Clostridium senegalense TaxID=1465809 RepID=A0A6M0H4Q7_9CLOT|nr:spore cortex biosynthesis protein YabQ [Clostridium senegalense]NEU05675.1 spore cortex biosynthesis protein YabQ [Clostridium senegalense]
MLFTMERQVSLLIFSILSGMLIGVLFDIYRIIRGFEDVGKIITTIQDVLFWIATGSIVFLFMMYTNYAYMDFNIFIYIALGLFVYIKFISRTFIDMLRQVMCGISTFIRRIFYILSYPVRICLNRVKGKIKN